VAADVPTVSVDEPPAATELGLKPAVAPPGRPLADSETVPGDPEVTAVDTVAVAVPPGATVAPAGDTAMEKSSLATTSVTVVEWLVEPSVPVTVTV
jgi:hypothetical protein